MKRNKNISHLLMLLLLLIWTIDAVTVSTAVESMSQIFLLCFKTACSIPILALFVYLREGLRLPKRHTIPLLLLATLLGDILYFFFEYTAYKYLPIGQVTILLGMLPAVSYLVDCIVARDKPRTSVVLTILMSIIGLAMVVWDNDTGGSFMGYFCCGICIAAWIAYGYTARKLDAYYSPETITLYEAIAAVAAMLPFALANRPGAIAPGVLWGSIIGMGIITTGFGYIIEVRGMIDLGTTTSGIYLNCLPVLTALAGFLFLNEQMTPLQIAGSGLVVLCSILVILLINAGDRK